MTWHYIREERSNDVQANAKQKSRRLWRATGWAIFTTSSKLQIFSMSVNKKLSSQESSQGLRWELEDDNNY